MPKFTQLEGCKAKTQPSCLQRAWPPGYAVLSRHRERAHGLGTHQWGDRGRRYSRWALRDWQDFRRGRKGGKRAEGTERVS